MIVQFLVAMAATVSFAVLYAAPYRELFFSGFSGAVGWVVYLYLNQELETGTIVACVMATFILTVIARILAVVRRCPVTVYLLVSIFPLVPGTGIYYTVYYLITRQSELFAATGLATFETAASIAFGIALGFGLPQSWFKFLYKFTVQIENIILKKKIERERLKINVENELKNRSRAGSGNGT
ncbi:MAG: threonine/serine exporter family protein, partial [Lachnospiraceae bacterium]|nr:threonine/serine exporter family protein [Lachnospiraceae bacterium]